MPAQAGIQKIFKILDSSVSCTGLAHRHASLHGMTKT
jgi:hypothetical protein